MTAKEFEEMVEKHGFDNAMKALYEECDLITDYDTLISFVISSIKKDNNMLALHVLNAIYNSEGDSNWYYYDYSEGTLCTPICLNTIEDVLSLGIF